ncbi:MAG: hypothetical protein D6704_07065 [Nitrospirae bacterium]|nr:MAG: hypothetical protein D6704_07065 [Nitrospirota bacterium]
MKPLTPPYSLAILPFDDYSNRAELAWLRQGLSEMLVTDLALLPHVHVVSRRRLGEVLQEQWLQQRNGFRDLPSARLGKLVGARYLLTGLYYVAAKPDGSMGVVIEAHLLDVERGEVLRTFRVAGPFDALPTLEWRLAQKISQTFHSPSLQRPPAEEVSRPSRSVDQELDEKSSPPLADLRHAGYPREFAARSAESVTSLAVDTALSLERLKDIRQVAKQLAHRLWSSVLRIRLGTPEYQPLRGPKRSFSRSLRVWIPVFVSMELESLSHLHPFLRVIDGEGNGSSPLVLAFDAGDTGAAQLFLETLRIPRRLFVRAIRESGQVVAVSSQWSWRMERLVSFNPEGTIELPASFMIKGRAGFPGTLLKEQGAAVHFDAVIVPVPEETRRIQVEIIEEQSEREPAADPEDEIPRDPRQMCAQAMRIWLLRHWAPPIVESLPFAGYLPGNHRTSILRVVLSRGSIQDIRLIREAPEEEMRESIQKVLAAFTPFSLSVCSDPRLKTSSNTVPLRVRVQFDLIKDIRFVGLQHVLHANSS